YSTAANADLYDHYSRFRWADAVAFLEDFPKAAAILQEGFTGTGADVYRPALARLYAAWDDWLGRDGKGDSAQGRSRLERGLSYDPTSVGLLDRLLNVTRMDIDGQFNSSGAASLIAYCGTLNGIQANALLVGARAVEMEKSRSLLRSLLAKGQA